MMPACELLRSQQRVSCAYSPQRARRSVFRGPLRVISEPLFNPTSHLSSAPVSYPIPRDNWTCVGFVDCFRLRTMGGKESIATNKPDLPTGVSPRNPDTDHSGCLLAPLGRDKRSP